MSNLRELFDTIDGRFAYGIEKLAAALRGDAKIAAAVKDLSRSALERVAHTALIDRDRAIERLSVQHSLDRERYLAAQARSNELSATVDRLNGGQKDPLLVELTTELGKHCGETGVSEGAIETLLRIVSERDDLKKQVSAAGIQLREQIDEELQQIDDAMAAAGGERDGDAVEFIRDLKAKLSAAQTVKRTLSDASVDLAKQVTELQAELECSREHSRNLAQQNVALGKDKALAEREPLRADPAPASADSCICDGLPAGSMHLPKCPAYRLVWSGSHPPPASDIEQACGCDESKRLRARVERTDRELTERQGDFEKVTESLRAWRECAAGLLPGGFDNTEVDARKQLGFAFTELDAVRLSLVGSEFTIGLPSTSVAVRKLLSKVRELRSGNAMLAEQKKQLEMLAIKRGEAIAKLTNQLLSLAKSAEAC